MASKITLGQNTFNAIKTDGYLSDGRVNREVSPNRWSYYVESLPIATRASIVTSSALLDVTSNTGLVKIVTIFNRVEFTSATDVYDVSSGGRVLINRSAGVNIDGNTLPAVVTLNGANIGFDMNLIMTVNQATKSISIVSTISGGTIERLTGVTPLAMTVSFYTSIVYQPV